MATAASITTTPAIYKYLYDQALEFEFYRASTFFDLVPKKEDWYGNSTYQVPISYGPAAGQGGTFAKSQTNQTAAASADSFSVARSTLYYTFTVDRQGWKASMNDMGAFYDLRLMELKHALKQQARNIAVSLYGRQNGVRAQVSTVACATNGQSTDQVTLLNTQDVTRFERNMPVNFGIIKSASVDFNQAITMRSQVSSLPAVISNIDRDNGILFFASGSIGGIGGGNGTTPAVAANDGIVLDGVDNVAFNGLPDWIPSATPLTGSTFLGVDRSRDTARLAGVRISGGNSNIKEALALGLQTVLRESEGMPDVILVSHRRWTDLSNLMDAGRRYTSERKSDSGWSYSALWLDSPEGSCEVLADNVAPDDKAYILELDTWELKSLDRLIDVADEDGLKMIRVYNADQFETRVITYGNLICRKPGNNGVVLLS